MKKASRRDGLAFFVAYALAGWLKHEWRSTLALDLKTRPHVIPWPPLIFAAACAFAVVLERVARG